MSYKRHLAGIVVCALLVAAAEYIGFRLSLEQFDPPLKELPMRSRLGGAICQFFFVPTTWSFAITGRDSAATFVVQWLLLPLLYGTALYFLFWILSSVVRRNV
jgi:hypothetical protein